MKEARRVDGDTTGLKGKMSFVIFSTNGTRVVETKTRVRN